MSEKNENNRLDQARPSRTESDWENHPKPGAGSLFSDWYRLAFKKIQQLQEAGMICSAIVLEHSSKGTAHVDRWGKVTWEDKH